MPFLLPSSSLGTFFILPDPPHLVAENPEGDGLKGVRKAIGEINCPLRQNKNHRHGQEYKAGAHCQVTAGR